MNRSHFARRSEKMDRMPAGRTGRARTTPMTGGPLMRTAPWTRATAAALLMLSVCRVRGDEPARPTAPASETNPAQPAAGHSVHGEAFNEGPRQRAYAMAGMGQIHFPVTTDKPEAQAF